MIDIIVIIIASLLAAFFYWVGGQSKDVISWANTKARDFGVPACAIATLIILGYIDWTLILVFGLNFASMTTYFKKKGADAVWWNWLLTGFFYSLATLPLVIVYHAWIAFALRTFLLSVATMLWSDFIDNDTLEESGRGFFHNITLLAFLIK